MVHYAYTPTYYSSFQHTLTSFCKSIFTHRTRRLPVGPTDHRAALRQSENLKWQQESFHKILNLIGLHKEGIVGESEVSKFRTDLLDALAASPRDREPACVVRDKLLFLGELFYAKCISAEEYHSSKRPLLQRLAVEGVEIDCRDVIVGDPATATEMTQDEWSVIELRDKESLPPPAEKTKSIFSWKGKGKKEQTNAGTGTLLMTANKPSKKQWGFDGLKKWKREQAEDASAVNMKEELSRIREELNATSPKISLSDDQVEAISSRLTADKADLNTFFPKSWCEKHGDTVLDVARKELKGRAGEMQSLRNTAKEKNSSPGTSGNVGDLRRERGELPSQSLLSGSIPDEQMNECDTFVLCNLSSVKISRSIKSCT